MQSPALFQIFSNIVHFCPNFQIFYPFCNFLTFSAPFCPFSEKSHVCPYFLNKPWPRKLLWIITKQNKQNYSSKLAKYYYKMCSFPVGIYLLKVSNRNTIVFLLSTLSKQIPTGLKVTKIQQTLTCSKPMRDTLEEVVKYV